MEAGAYMKNLRISPKKLRFFLPGIKKMSPVEALERLNYTVNKPGKIFYNSIKSAVTNAKNVLKVDEKNLRFKEVIVEEGHRLKRYKAGGRGTAKPILKRFAHLKIILVAEEPKVEVKAITKKEIVTAKSKTAIKSKPKLKISKKKLTVLPKAGDKQ